MQGCYNLLVSKEDTYEVEHKECKAEGGHYVKLGSNMFDYECIFEVIPLNTMIGKDHHKARLKECHAKGGQYVNLTEDEFGYDCLNMNAPKKTSPYK